MYLITAIVDNKVIFIDYLSSYIDARLVAENWKNPDITRCGSISEGMNHQELLLMFNY